MEPDKVTRPTPSPYLADCGDVDDARDQRRRVENAASGAGVVRRSAESRLRAAAVRNSPVRAVVEVEASEIPREAVRRGDRS